MSEDRTTYGTQPTSDSATGYREHLDTLQRRYTAALERASADRAVIFAGNPVYTSYDDQPYPWRCDPWFAQWLPFAHSSGAAIEFVPGERPKLHVPNAGGFWHTAPRLPDDAFLQHFDVVHQPPTNIVAGLRRDAQRTVALGADAATLDALQVRCPPEFKNPLIFDRAQKTAWERECMARATAIAVQGHRAVAEAAADGVSEFALHMLYNLASQQSDTDLPYPSIVGLNEHGAVLHYEQRERAAPQSYRSLLIDAGATCHGYAADITRTHCAGSDTFSALIERIDELQQYVCSQVRAGMDFVALNTLCHEALAGVLEEFELVSCTAAAAFDAGVTRVFLPHGLGHLLGLQVHDVGGHMSDCSGETKSPPQSDPYLRLTRQLTEDMVVTIEPGLYFIAELIGEFEQRCPGILRHDTIDALRPFGGIRIEDDVQVESRGHRNLTRIAFGD